MFEHRRLAQAHEEAQHKDEYGEANEAGLKAERYRPFDAIDHITCWRIGEQKCRRDADEKGPIHDLPGADLVRQMPAVDAEERSGHRECRCDHAGRLEVKLINADQIAREPKRQRHKRAEHKEVIQRKTPDLDILKRRKLLRHAAGLDTRGAARSEVWVV